MLEQHVGTEARRKLLKTQDVQAEPFADSVGVGSYRIDLHPSTGGDNYIDISSLPFQIPLGALIPRGSRTCCRLARTWVRPTSPTAAFACIRSSGPSARRPAPRRRFAWSRRNRRGRSGIRPRRLAAFQSRLVARGRDRLAAGDAAVTLSDASIAETLIDYLEKGSHEALSQDRSTPLTVTSSPFTSRMWTRTPNGLTNY